MNRGTASKGELRKILIGTIAAIGFCTLSFWGSVQVAYTSEINRTDIVPAPSGTITSDTASVPEGYVKANYQVKLGQYSDSPTAKDMTKEEAAERGAQNLWKLFAVDLEGKTVEMSYHAAGPLQPRAEWAGTIAISESQSYQFSVDAVTGECRTVGQSKYWDVDLDVGMDKSLLTIHEKYAVLAKVAAEKYQLVPGKVSSVEYEAQGYTSNSFGKNPDITMVVNSENGEQAQVTFSRYNQELLTVEYDSWVKDARVVEKQLDEQAAKDAQILKWIDEDSNGQPVLREGLLRVEWGN